MDCTQALDDDFTTDLGTSDDERRQVGWLEVGDSRHDIFLGDNRIGRDPSLCQIVIDSKTLSKEHAVIEVCGDGTPFIYDLRSLNKTRLGKTVLQPEARYQLLDGSEILFADIKAVYKTISDAQHKEDDTGSETGSESMLNISAAEDNVIPATPAPTRLKPSIIEETVIENDLEDKQKLTFKSPETASAAEAPACTTSEEQSDDIYEAETQADECFMNASDIRSTETNDDNTDGLNITDDIFAAETQCDENYMSAEEQGNEEKDESTNTAFRKSSNAADQGKSICEAENQSLDHISPSQNAIKQPGINKLNREGVTASTNIIFEDDKDLSASSEKNMNSKTLCPGKSVTISENNNLEKNNNKVDVSQDSPKACADNVNPVLDTSIDDDDNIYEADTLCMESEFQFSTPKRPLTKKDTIEESENEEDITEMATQYLDLPSPSPNLQKSAETRGGEQDISEMATQQIDLEPPTPNQHKLAETKHNQQDINEMATQQIDLDRPPPNQQRLAETKASQHNKSEMAIQQTDLEPTSTKHLKSSIVEDTEQDISEMETQQLDLEPAFSSELVSAEAKNDEKDVSDLGTQQPASANQLRSAETGDNEQKSLCMKVGESESEVSKAVEKQINLSNENVEETSQQSTEDPSSPSLLQEDDEDLNGHEQRCSDGFNKNDKQIEGFNKSTGKDKIEFQKNNVVATNLAINNETFKPVDHTATDSGDETDSENIFEAQTQLFSENKTNNASERSTDIHGEEHTGNENEVITDNAETKSTEIVGCPQENDDDDTKSEDLHEAYLQAKSEEDRCTSYPFVKGNTESLQENASSLQHSNLKKSEECKGNADSDESDDIYDASTQIIDFDTHSKTNIDINHTRKNGFENQINISKNLRNHSVQPDLTECASANITKAHKNSPKHCGDNSAEITKDSLLQNTEETSAQKLPEACNKAEVVLTNSKTAKKENVSINLKERDTENIFEAATQVIEDGKPVSPQPCTAKPLNLEAERTPVPKVTEHNSNNESEHCSFSELSTQRIENESYHTSGNLTTGKHDLCSTDHVSKEKKSLIGTEVDLKSKQGDTHCSSQEASDKSNQANQSTESCDSLTDAPTQILNEDIDIPVDKPNVTVNQSADTSCDKTSGKLTTGKHDLCNTDHASKEKESLIGTEVDLKSKKGDTYCSSHEASDNPNQANQSIESDDSLMDAPTQILNEAIDNMPVNKPNVTVNQSADSSCNTNKEEQDFEIKTVHHKRYTPRKNQGALVNKPTTLMSSAEENLNTKSEMQNQVSPTRSPPKDEEMSVSPTLPSRISKHAPVSKRRGNRNILSEMEKNVTIADVAKTRKKKAAETSKQNQNIKDDTGHYLDSSALSVLESSTEAKQSGSKEIQGRRKRNNKGNKAEDSPSRNVSVHSKNKMKDITESPAENASQNLRPSRQRKMTWKVRESLMSDQETSDSEKSSRKRSTAILDNSDAEINTPIKARKESSSKTEKLTTQDDSVFEHSNDASHSKVITRRRKPDLSEQGSSYQKDKTEENTSLTDLNISNASNRATKRKVLDFDPPSSSKRFKGEVQKSFPEKENPIEDTNAALLVKKDKNTDSKTGVRISRITRGKRESAIEEAVTVKRETRQASNDKSKSKNLRKQSNPPDVKELEPDYKPELEAQASVSAKGRSRRGNAKTSLRLTEHNKAAKERKLDLDTQEEEKLGPVVNNSSKSGLPQTRSRRAAKEVENEKSNNLRQRKINVEEISAAKEVENGKSSNLRQRKINVEERPDPGGSSEENKNCTKTVDTLEKERSSSRRKRKANNADAVESEECSESLIKRSKSNAKKASGKQMEQSNVAQTSTQSISKSNTPNKSTPRKRGKASVTNPEKKEDQSHSRNDSNNDTSIVTPKRASRRGDGQNSSSSENLASTPQRSTPRRIARSQESECRVLFTGISDAKQEAIVKSLGGTVVDLPESCTVLVTDKVRRTFKFLCIMGKGKPIVSPMWLTQSKQAGKFLDPWKYLIKDQESETKFRFSLKNSLECASKTNLLAGYNIFVTPKVLPPPPEMRGIVESCGGTYIPHWPSSNWPEKSFIISCNEDKAQWTKLKKSGKPIVGAEILLLGILQQKLDIKSNTLV